MTDSGLRAVFLAERRMLLRLLTARTGNADDAEDVLQDMWMKLETAGSGPVAQPAAYLYRMANNLAFDRRRSATRHAARDTAWLQIQTTADEMPSVEEQLIARERLAHVEAALAALPERVSRAFRLFRFEGVSQKAIAAELNISLSSVEKLLQQAYRKIHDRGREKMAGLTPLRRPGHEEDFSA